MRPPTICDELPAEGTKGVAYVLALGDGSEANLDLSLGQDVGGGGHVDQEVCKTDVYQPRDPTTFFQSCASIM